HIVWLGRVVLHALAFNTLLSSQETDAFTIRPNFSIRSFRGVSFRSFRCVFILSDPLFRVKPIRADPFDSI
ncbi:hypothetical protein AB0395_44565, partial [Streptosporangium sp. NPDC051023]|uniref:hypothetical protein n=1 Tax=Streptosporangium sp. NPDC051023 TaxID=3155410 RepID=UPI00344CC41E